MRRRALACLAMTLPVALLAGAPAANAQARPDLVISAAAEPPDFELPGGRFRHSFTVANEGGARSTDARLRAVLSRDPALGGGDDFPLRGTARTSSLLTAIGARKQRTRRITLNIPDNVPPDFYFLIECADGGNRVRESNERNNCRVSGQRVGINASERGQPGPKGETGPVGPPGRSIDRRRLARTTLDLGRSTIEGPGPDPEDDEGSTVTAELAKVGPISVRALCRATSNGDGDEPGTAFGPVGQFDETGDEAKILLYADSGVFSFQGLTGPRANIPAGEGTPDAEGPDGGEGKHQFIATLRDPDPNTQTGGSNNGVFEREFAFGFRSYTGWVSHSSGLDLIVSAYAGIDVLGVGDRCVFSGLVTVVNQAE
jgi:hypothetical protein